jgi:hypothetical protein
MVVSSTVGHMDPTVSEMWSPQGAKGLYTTGLEQKAACHVR